MVVRYLVYVSRLAEAEGGVGFVPAIIRSARMNNAIRSITGALMFDGERFCQYIEGPPDEIVRVYTAIERDPRHTDLRVLTSGFAPSRRFAQWSMAYVYAVTPELIDVIGERPVPAVADAFEASLARCDVDA